MQNLTSLQQCRQRCKSSETLSCVDT